MKINFLILFTLFSLSCSTQKKQTESRGQFTEISFGSGGGFTGVTNTYLLKANRQVFKLNNGEFVKINTISKPDLNKISEYLKDLDFYNMKFSEKGNMTYFIEVKSSETANKVTWTDGSQKPELKELYKTLVGTLKQ